MALALNNAQGELHPLEVGMHALKSGISQKDYAARIGKSQQSVGERVCAARVAETLTGYPVIELTDRWQHLSAIHASPRWLWSALVSATARGAGLEPIRLMFIG